MIVLHTPVPSIIPIVEKKVQMTPWWISFGGQYLERRCQQETTQVRIKTHKSPASLTKPAQNSQLPNHVLMSKNHNDITIAMVFPLPNVFTL